MVMVRAASRYRRAAGNQLAAVHAQDEIASRARLDGGHAMEIDQPGSMHAPQAKRPQPPHNVKRDRCEKVPKNRHRQRRVTAEPDQRRSCCGRYLAAVIAMAKAMQ
jgi:hypothetical protein